jgi:hypothetical protein
MREVGPKRGPVAILAPDQSALDVSQRTLHQA